jgi:hypothetical protein
MKYLMIQNPGVAPVEGFTLLGMSTTRDCGVDGTTGQFGSGNKHAINLLLRAGLKVIVYCGKTRMTFFTKTETVNDGLVEKEVSKVYCKLGGTSTKLIDCGWCLDFGAIDWNDTAMALREFISNAIDRTIREKKEFIRALQIDRDLEVCPVGESQRKARDGYTRVYVEFSTEVQKFYGELPKRFLHFSENPDQVYQHMLPKAERNLSNSKTAMIYRGGVFVREISETVYPSLFDYNFAPTDLPIDECRNSSEYATRAACAKLVKKADADVLGTIFASLLAGEETFESAMDPYYLCPEWSTPQEEETKEWKKAWEQTAGTSANGASAVLVDAEQPKVAEVIQRKGHKTKPVKSKGWVEAAGRMGVSTPKDVLDENESKGREIREATAAGMWATEIVWAWLEALDMLQDKTFPEVGTFSDIMSAESSVFGFQKGKGVYYREDIASDANKFLLKVAFEEVVHYVTGATDNSRDFQNFLIDVVVELAI